eukprot:3933376-Rhodomonas_salina.1
MRMTMTARYHYYARWLAHRAGRRGGKREGGTKGAGKDETRLRARLRVWGQDKIGKTKTARRRKQ